MTPSKFVQIITTTFEGEPVILALAQDGTCWRYRYETASWHRFKGDQNRSEIGEDGEIVEYSTAV